MSINKLTLELQDLKKIYKHITFYFLDEVDSTNTYCKQLGIQKFTHPILVISDSQSCGKGTKGRNWSSPKGKGLWFSILMHPKFNIANLSLVPMITSVALIDTLKYLGVSATIKWPNDIYLNNKKICGILTESNLSGNIVDYLIIGIGLNVNLELSDFDDELSSKATSLQIEYNKLFSRYEILDKFIENFNIVYNNLCNNKLDIIIKKYKANSCILNKKVSLIKNNSYEIVTPIDILPDGSLLVLDSSNVTKKIYSGEVSLRF